MHHCLLCKRGTLNFLFSAGNYHIMKCTICYTAQTYTPIKQARKQIYQKEDLGIYVEKEQEFSRLFQNIITFIKQFKQSGILVDIGAGVGLLVREAQKAGYKAYGYEPSKDAVNLAKKIFSVQLEQKTFTHKKADIVVLNHVLEHVPDPHKLLVQIQKSIYPHGYVFVGVPNFGCLLAQLKTHRWQSLIANQHRWHFTKKTLNQLIVPYGFQQVGIRTENHDRSIHPLWKRPFYFVLDTITKRSNNGEAIFVAFKKI